MQLSYKLLKVIMITSKERHLILINNERPT